MKTNSSQELMDNWTDLNISMEINLYADLSMEGFIWKKYLYHDTSCQEMSLVI